MIGQKSSNHLDLEKKQILECKGDWFTNNKNLSPGGWAFQYENDFYPDVDDTAVVAMFLDRAGYQNKKSLKDGRTLAVNANSRDFLKKIGLWGAMQNDEEPINKIVIKDFINADELLFENQDESMGSEVASGLKTMKATRQPSGCPCGPL